MLHHPLNSTALSGLLLMNLTGIGRRPCRVESGIALSIYAASPVDFLMTVRSGQCEFQVK